MKYDTACVIGAGAFGTSIASVLSNNFKKVILLVRDKNLYNYLLQGKNPEYLPGFKLKDQIVPALSWDEVSSKIEGKMDLLVSGLPSTAILEYFKKNNKEVIKYLQTGIPLVSLAKGLDVETLELSDDLFHHNLKSFEEQICYLSGPSFAHEIVEEQITLVSLAGASKETLTQASLMFRTNYFKTIPTTDIKGVLLGGALKNMLAIAAGIAEGLGYSHNTRAALITKGIEEMLRFSQVFGESIRPETFYGLSGIGDLILTATSGESRNYHFGMEIGQGKNPEKILKEHKGVVEGYRTTEAVYLLAQKHKIECWIFNGLYEVLYKGKDPKIAISQLLKLIPKYEVG